jgi:hypothetical protein
MDPESRRDLRAELLDAAIELMGRSGRIGRLPMRGGSMLPTLRPGQIVAVEFAPWTLERGDLLVFRQGDYLVVHRYLGPAWRRDGTACLRTRGDNVPSLDPPVDRDRVLGRVLAVEDADGWWDLRGGAAGAYSVALALHGLFWAAVTVLAGKADALLLGARSTGRLRGFVVRWDRRLLGWIHRWMFALLHARIPEPLPERGPGGLFRREIGR